MLVCAEVPLVQYAETLWGLFPQDSDLVREFTPACQMSPPIVCLQPFSSVIAQNLYFKHHFHYFLEDQHIVSELINLGTGSHYVVSVHLEFIR